MKHLYQKTTFVALVLLVVVLTKPVLKGIESLLNTYSQLFVNQVVIPF